jgi:hypothetical protein
LSDEYEAGVTREMAPKADYMLGNDPGRMIGGQG